MNKTTIEVNDGKFIKNKSKTKVPLTSTIIREALSAQIEDEQKIEEIMALMKALRPKNERKYLKRTYTRKSTTKVNIKKKKKKKK